MSLDFSSNVSEEAGNVSEGAGVYFELGNRCQDLVGTWELMSSTGTPPILSEKFLRDSDIQGTLALLVMNKTHWVSFRESSGHYIGAQGGRYGLESTGLYTEVVEYSAIPENVGQRHRFECLLEGDSLWHRIDIQSDTRYGEVWRRVKE